VELREIAEAADGGAPGDDALRHHDADVIVRDLVAIAAAGIVHHRAFLMLDAGDGVCVRGSVEEVDDQGFRGRGRALGRQNVEDRLGR
jgi:hypothetical protein